MPDAVRITDEQRAVYTTGYKLFREPTDPSQIERLHAAVRELQRAGTMPAQDIGEWLADGIFDSALDLLEAPAPSAPVKPAAKPAKRALKPTKVVALKTPNKRK